MKSMADFVTVATTDELPPNGEPIVFELGRKWIALYNIEGNYYAIEDTCTHDGGPLVEGEREGCVVECPRHGARFDIRNGEFLAGPAGTVDVPAYEVRVEGNEIQVGSRKRS